MHPSVECVVTAAAAKGLALEIRETAGARSAEDAARSLGVPVGRIVKSLVFVGSGEFVGHEATGSPEKASALLLLVSGSNRVDEAKVAVHVGHAVRRATAGEAKAATGFAIGGVSPFGSTGDVRVLMDEELFAHPTVWAAAGTPLHVFEIVPLALRSAAGAEVLSLKV